MNTSSAPNGGEPTSTPKTGLEKKPKPANKKAMGSSTPIPPVANQVVMKTRHYGLIIGFLLFVLVPVSCAGVYLFQYGKDQFVSEVGFTVRREDAPLTAGLISSLGQLSSSSSNDSDILYEFVRSQELVKRIDAQLNLKGLFSEVYNEDPFFGLKPDANIEELVKYWRRMVQVSFTPGTGLLELQVRAFSAEDANRIATLIFSESSEMINELSSIAREDATRYARDDLELAQTGLKDIRTSITQFRTLTQIVDPEAAIQGQMGLLNSLQQQLGEALIEFDLLSGNTSNGDPRLGQSENRIAAIRNRIQQERQKFGPGGDATEGQDYATVIAEFERLSVEREFAEQKYSSALANLDNALTEARRQNRYLAAYVGPTIAESPEHPRRYLLLGLVALFSLLNWSIVTLIYYSLRERR